ncbi:MAG: beta-ketoacyl-[acyl-carrier-protein] synthase family protein [Acidimicrobiia bacterium]|nr:beta-ketoacyl-[acyl-carrier-protein] synthase family protein [Acidimicrobiia bacterium]
MSDGRRAAIVGVGVKAPGGCDPATFWQAVLAGRGQAREIPELADHHEVSAASFGCEVSDDDSAHERYFRKPELRRIDDGARLGVAAAADAMAGLDGLVPPERRAAVVGTGVGGLRTYRTQSALLHDVGVARASPFTVPMMMPNSLAGWLSLRHGLQGPCHTIAAACASAAASIGEAMIMIRDGRADMVVAGGAEAVMFTEVFVAFARMEALAKPSERRPDEASRPFDVDRNGFVMGEGAGMVVLAAADVARAADLDVLGWVDGYGCSSDAHHMAAPPEDGAGAVRSMIAALHDAGLSSGDIVHINAHGTSTPRNDLAESRAIVTVFGDSCPPVTSTKGVTGHLLGAGGAVEAIAALIAASTGIVPPVANTETVDSEIAIDVVTGSPRTVPVGPALSSSFAFGGHNASLVVSPVVGGADVLAGLQSVSGASGPG